MNPSHSLRGSYQRLQVQVHPSVVEAVAYHLESLGAQGVEVAEVPGSPDLARVIAYYPWDGDHWPARPGLGEDDRTGLGGRVSVQEVERWLRNLPSFGLNPGPQMTVEESRVAAEDWATQWKQYFHPLPVGRHFLICPSWEVPSDEVEPDRIRLILDPGQAFGTGQHPTTQLALEWLEDSIAAADARVESLIDVGCGSGILAVAARKLGVRHVWAVDVDPVAVAACQENLERNGVAGGVEVLSGSWEVLRSPLAKASQGRADVVVANILAEVIVPLTRDLHWLLKPEGIFIGSGISAARVAEVEEALRQAGWIQQEWRPQGGWRAVKARRARVGLVSLGCKVNQYEIDALAGQLEAQGLVPCDADGPADAYCLNTCAVTGVSEKKSRQWTRRLHERNPNAPIVVMGCLSQASPEAVAALPGVELVVGSQGRGAVAGWLAQRLRELTPQLRTGTVRPPAVESWVQPVYRQRHYEELALPRTGQTRAVVKVQDGCSLFCSYCLIPHVRGPSRSRDPQAVLAEVRRLVEAGFQEIVITGIHLGGYGQDLLDGWNLARLLRLVGSVEGLKRLRLSSLDPHEVTEEVLESLQAIPAFCPHLHLPLQSGDDRILRAMRRRHTADQLVELAERLRRIWPQIALTTDVITGFPGETEKAFARTVEVCRQVGFSRLHVFPYSARQRTPAARFPDQVPVEVRHERARQLIEVGRELALAYHRRWLGCTVEVLVEQVKPGQRAEGLTREYVRVQVADTTAQGGSEPWAGRIVPVQITEVQTDRVVGRLLGVRSGGKQDGLLAMDARGVG
ncbi:MAG: tRNA (N(6)-L-threonylcarbamoyladenosine(37)-C(2))-methylthiotransferase MtaB [Limnochordaceae bacterium]|nr:tRNA (N(6)-L-threonylcarbamoyladenosine(37)-C(2))-methylthiotransferase MtaB [Limnochordaceae bacterium]